MICTVCGSDNAKIFIRNKDGRELRLTLCNDCYARLYPEQESGFFAAFVGRTRASSRTRACPSCGTTLEDFRHSGLLGCAVCYSAFREELLPTIRQVQGRTEHIGRAPSGEAEGKYDYILDLAGEQERIKAAIAEAKARGDGAAVEALRRELERVNRRLAGGEAIG